MPEGESMIGEAHPHQRRRRSRRKGMQRIGIGRAVFWTMLVLTLASGAFLTHRMRMASLMAGPLMLDIPQQEVRYLRGEPQSISADGWAWTYQEGPGAEGTVRFGADGLVAEIDCMQVDSAVSGCPEPMGIAMGTSEDVLVNRLGPATSQGYVQGGKQMVFADLGLIFIMREFRVVGVRKIRRSGRVDFLPRVGWNVLP